MIFGLILAALALLAGAGVEHGVAPGSLPVSYSIADLFSLHNLLALLTLSTLEIVLGVDNIVIIAIITSRVEPTRQSRCRRMGLFAAMFMRIGLLLSIYWIMSLTRPLFPVFGHNVTGKDLVLIIGGMFLLIKAFKEVRELVDTEEAHRAADGSVTAGRKQISFMNAIVQIMFIDIVFSLDSVITAVGMAQHIYVMIAAVILAVLVMMLFADPIAVFIERFPTVKMLALTFLLLIGGVLILDGIGRHVSKNYVYAMMGFSLALEFVNQWAVRRNAQHYPRMKTVGLLSLIGLGFLLFLVGHRVATYYVIAMLGFAIVVEVLNDWAARKKAQLAPPPAL